MNFSEATFFFLFYACLGWCAEVSFAALKNGRFVNRGFLNGPWCPIYGFGATLVLLLLEPLQHDLLALFVGSCAITTLLEYVTGVALEKLFNTRWWDYSEMPFNIGGHICLLFTVLWGLACTFIVRIIHPLIAGLYAIIPRPVLTVILIVMTGVMLYDAVITLLTAHKLSRKLQRIDQLAGELRKLSDELGENIFERVNSIENRAEDARDWWDESVRPKLEALDDAADRRRKHWNSLTDDIRDRIDEIGDSIAEKRANQRMKLRQLADVMRRSAAEKRLLNAFPNMRSLRNPRALERLRQHYQRKK